MITIDHVYIYIYDFVFVYLTHAHLVTGSSNVTIHPVVRDLGAIKLRYHFEGEIPRSGAVSTSGYPWIGSKSKAGQ